MTNPVHFVITGGTIDKIYDPVIQDFKPNAHSFLPGFLSDIIHPAWEATFETLFMKDSREFTPKNLNQILEAIKNSKTKSIVITHGTDTMPNTAEFLQKELPKDHGKTIVMVGSFVPLRQFADSDGGFNLGFAIASALHLKPGIYIAMHAEIFEAGKVRKNTKTARFEVKK